MLQDAWVGSEVGQDHVVGSEELQIDLRVVFVAPGPGIERSVEPGPVSCPVTELHVVPDLVRVAVFAPRCSRLAYVFFHARKGGNQRFP